MKKENEYFNQRFELLTLYNDFNQDIDNFRKNWGILVSDCKKYQKTLITKLDYKSELQTILEKRYLDYEGDLIEKYGKGLKYKGSIKKIKDSNTKILNKLLVGGSSFGIRTEPTPFGLYQESFNNLLSKYNLSRRYEEAIKYYIYKGTVSDVSAVTVRGNLGGSYVEKNDLKFLELIIYPETSLEDMSIIWKEEIKSWQKISKRKTRYRPFEQYELIKMIWALNNCGKSNDEILEIVNREFYAIYRKTTNTKKINNNFTRYERRRPGVGSIQNSISPTIIDTYLERAKERIFETEAETPVFLLNIKKK